MILFIKACLSAAGTVAHPGEAGRTSRTCVRGLCPSSSRAHLLPPLQPGPAVKQKSDLSSGFPCSQGKRKSLMGPAGPVDQLSLTSHFTSSPFVTQPRQSYFNSSAATFLLPAQPWLGLLHLLRHLFSPQFALSSITLRLFF